MNKKQYELAERDYIDGAKYKEIAEKYGVSLNTVKQWKRRYAWQREKSPSMKKVYESVRKNVKQAKEKSVQDTEGTLSDKEQMFCTHYVRTWNATQATLLSGYSQNKATAAINGNRLLKLNRVRNEVERLKAIIRTEIKVDILDLLDYCMRIIGADIGDYITFGQRDEPVVGADGAVMDENGKPLTETVNYVALSDSKILDTTVIDEIKQGKSGVSIKLADKKWAWEQVIKYFDLLPDKHKRQIDKEKLQIMRDRNKEPALPPEPLVLQPIYGKPKDDGDG